MKQILVSLSKRFRRPTEPGSRAVPSRMEGLESRLLMAADGPRVLSVVADNRGLVTLTFDRSLEPTSLTNADVLILTAGKDKKLGTKDDVSQPISGTILNGTAGPSSGLQISTPLAADTPYRIVLVAGGVTGGNKKALDGESVGSGVLPSGNGTAGGNFDVVVTPFKKPVARVYTGNGAIDVSLYNKVTPISVANFIKYANGGQWDTTLFHRLVPGFVLQAGGFRVTKHNATDKVANFGTIKNEPGLSNTLGTVAYAKLGGDANSASNQFFFNLGNNAANLDQQNGGFTVFGAVANAASMSVLASLGQAGTEGTVDPNTGDLVNPVTIAGQPFTNVPINNTATFEARNRVLNPGTDLVRIIRVALLEAIVPTPGSLVLAAPKAVRASVPAIAASTATVTAAATASKTVAATGGSLMKVFASGGPMLSSDASVLD